MSIVLSIGLNVGAVEPAGQLGATVRGAEALFGPPLSLAMGRGTGEGQPERFVQIAVLCPLYQALKAAPLLARALHQDAVALTSPGQPGGWTLFHADGRIAAGGTLKDFPIITEVPEEQ